MIGMSSSAKSFGALAHYLANGRSGNDPERVAWSTSRNLPTDEPELAGKIMRATASQNVRVTQPGYHVALSFDPGDAVDRAAMERVADRTIEALGLAAHQVLIVCHRDRDHPHMHLLINRVHPETGRVWNRWQDRAVIQKVLREEEIALGLRVTPGRLAAPERNQLDLGLPEQPSVGPTTAREPESLHHGESRAPRTKFSLTEELRSNLDDYAHVVDLYREQYNVQLEANAARVRSTQLEEAAERATTADSTFKTVLADIYRDPIEARNRFVALAQTRGLGAAVETLQERPEELGALVTVAKSRAFGLRSSERDTRARGAAVGAGIKGRDFIEATEHLHEIAAGAKERRLATASRRSLRDLFVDPATAETALRRLAIDRGSVTALEVLERQPQEIAELRGSKLDPAAITRGGERAALAFREILNPTSANGLSIPGRGIIESEITAGRAEVERAQSKDVAIRRELTSSPDRSELERRILAVIDRMSPREVRQLRATLLPPQVALALKLKRAVRDTVLGRDEMNHR
jgi:hypothetical protein